MDKFTAILENRRRVLLSEDEAFTSGEQFWNNNQVMTFLDQIKSGNYAGALGTAIYDPSLETTLNPTYILQNIKEPLDNMIASVNNVMGDIVGINQQVKTEAIEPDLVPNTQPEPITQPDPNTQPEPITQPDPNTQPEQPGIEQFKTTLSPILGEINNTIKKVKVVFSEKNINQLATNLKDLAINHPVELKQLNDMATSSNWKNKITDLANDISNSGKVPAPISSMIQGERFNLIINDYVVLNEMAIGKAILSGIFKGTKAGKHIKRATTAVEMAKKIKTLKASLSRAFSAAKIADDNVVTARTALKAADAKLAAATAAKVGKRGRHLRAAEALENIAKTERNAATSVLKAETAKATTAATNLKRIQLQLDRARKASSLLKPIAKKIAMGAGIVTILGTLPLAIAKAVVNVLGFIIQQTITMPIRILMLIIEKLKKYKNFLLKIFIPVQVIGGVIINSGGGPGTFTGPMLQELLQKVTDLGIELLTDLTKLLGLDKLVENMLRTGRGVVPNLKQTSGIVTDVIKNVGTP